MKPIYDYLDYRQYLLDFYNAKKKRNPCYSYQVFAQMAGLKSKSHLKLIIDGKRNLTPQTMKKMNKALKLSAKAFTYFEDLAAFCHEKDPDIREQRLLRLAQYNKRNAFRVTLRRQYDFYAQWYHNTVRELAAHGGMGDDAGKIAKSIRPRLSSSQAKQSLKMLVDLGFLKKSGAGYAQADKLISTGDEVKSVAVRAFHQRNMALASEAIDAFARNERDISALVVGLSDEGFTMIKKEIQQFRKRLLRIVERDSPVRRVYHINFQIFPTSDRVEPEESNT
jgi:uncharacterized protein (TIGR02147 family)